MKNLIDNTKLEKLLLANWSNFLDQKKLIAYTLTCVRDYKFNQVVKTNKKHSTNIKVKLSHFQIKNNGFNLWVEYSIPINQNTAIGTVELLLSNSGKLSHIQTIGTLFK